MALLKSEPTKCEVRRQFEWRAPSLRCLLTICHSEAEYVDGISYLPAQIPEVVIRLMGVQRDALRDQPCLACIADFLQLLLHLVQKYTLPSALAR